MTNIFEIAQIVPEVQSSCAEKCTTLQEQAVFYNDNEGVREAYEEIATSDDVVEAVISCGLRAALEQMGIELPTDAKELHQFLGKKCLQLQLGSMRLKHTMEGMVEHCPTGGPLTIEGGEFVGRHSYCNSNYELPETI